MDLWDTPRPFFKTSKLPRPLKRGFEIRAAIGVQAVRAAPSYAPPGDIFFVVWSSQGTS